MQIVVSRFNENVEWTKQFQNVIIYNKGDVLQDKTYNSIILPNVGREGHTYYTHIYNNYDNLDDYTAFLQGNPFDHSPNIIHDLLSYLPHKNDFKFLSYHILKTSINHCPYHDFDFDDRNLYFNVYKTLFNDHYTNTLIEFGAGAQFIVSKKFILSKPKSFYLKIINLLNHSSHPKEGFPIERFHRIILDSEYKFKSEKILP
jgi:hypothetical protein